MQLTYFVLATICLNKCIFTPVSHIWHLYLQCFWLNPEKRWQNGTLQLTRLEYILTLEDDLLSALWWVVTWNFTRKKIYSIIKKLILFPLGEIKIFNIENTCVYIESSFLRRPYWFLGKLKIFKLLTSVYMEMSPLVYRSKTWGLVYSNRILVFRLYFFYAILREIFTFSGFDHIHVYTL